MSLIINGTTVNSVIYNGVNLTSVVFNGVTIWEAVKYITVAGSVNNLDLRAVYQSLYGDPSSGITVVFTINGALVFGSGSVNSPAVNVGSWPSGVTLQATINSGTYLVGKGGDATTTTGGNGGTALYTRYPITITNYGVIGGGGGAGGSYSAGTGNVYGGGGAGNNIGYGYGGSSNGALSSGANGTSLNLGYGSWLFGGKGGDLGTIGEGAYGQYLDGPKDYVSSGGIAGLAVDGNSYVTWANLGDIRGSRVN